MFCVSCCRATSLFCRSRARCFGVAFLDGGQQAGAEASGPRAHSSRAFWMSSGARTGLTGWLRPLTTLPMSSPAAAALTSIPGSMGGSNSGISWTWPSMFSQLRILDSRSSTVSQ